MGYISIQKTEYPPVKVSFNELHLQIRQELLPEPLRQNKLTTKKKKNEYK